MSNGNFKIKKGLNLDPQTGSTVSAEGDLAYNDTSKKLEIHDGTSADPVVQEAKSATLTNKTISGSSNTLSNIADTSLSTISTAGKVSNSATTAASTNTASAIVARDSSGNFSAGTITATSFSGPLTGNVTGNASGTSATFTGSLTGDVTSTGMSTSIAAATVTGKAITGFTSGAGTVAATDTVLQAINKLDGNTTAHTSATTAHGATGAVVGTTNTQTLSSKTFGDAITTTQIATPSNPSAGLNKVYTKSDNKLYVLDSSGNEKSTGGLSAWAGSVSYAVGDVVSYEKCAYICLTAHTSTTMEADIQASKWVLLNTPTIMENLMPVGNNFEDAEADAWTATGCATITNGLPVSVGSGGAAFSSSNGGRAKGSSTNAVSVDSSNAINGKYALNLSTTGAGTIGDGYISQAYNISPKYRAQVLQVKFSYKVASGSPVMSGTAANTYAVAVYDVINNSWFGLAGQFNLVQLTGIGTFSGTFQTASNSTAFQVFVYSPVAPTGTSSLLLDDFYVGPQPFSMGPAMSDWTSYVPTVTGSTSNPTKGTIAVDSARWRRVGSLLEIHYEYRQTAAGSAGSGYYSFSLPAGLTIDTSLITLGATSAERNNCGYGYGYDGTNNHGLAISAATTTTFTAQEISSSGGALGSSLISLGSTVAAFTLNVRVPIVGWSSNTVQSADTDTRKVDFAGTKTSNQAVTASVTDIAFGTVVDSHGAWSGSVYTVPVSGDYFVSAVVADTGTNGWVLSLYKGGTFYKNLSQQTGGLLTSGSVLCGGLVAGDTISLRVHVTTTIAGGASLGSQTNLSISRISGPAVVQATESVNMRYTSTSSAAATLGAFTDFAFATKKYDSHSAYSSASYTVPVQGKYRIAASLTLGSTLTTSQQFVIQAINATSGEVLGGQKWVGNGVFTQASSTVSGTIGCNAGDVLKIQYFGTSGITSPAFNGVADFQWVSIERVGN